MSMSGDNEIFDILSDSSNPWQRQSSVDTAGVVRWESAKAHRGFRTYCELGDSRSVRAVAKALNKSHSLIGRWASRWKWQERVKTYDDTLREAELEGFIKARREMAIRQSKVAVLGQNLAVTALMELQERLRARGKRRGLTPYEAVRLFEACSKIERICRGGMDTANDQVAAINVTVTLQERPRYLDAADPVDPKTEYDS
jgi:hypothetical protein